MPAIITKDDIEIFYKDWGSAQPIVFSHGWPLSADDWDAQLLFFLLRARHEPLRRRPGFQHGMPAAQADTTSADLFAFIRG